MSASQASASSMRSMSSGEGAAGRRRGCRGELADDGRHAAAEAGGLGAGSGQGEEHGAGVLKAGFEPLARSVAVSEIFTLCSESLDDAPIVGHSSLCISENLFFGTVVATA